MDGMADSDGNQALRGGKPIKINFARIPVKDNLLIKQQINPRIQTNLKRQYNFPQILLIKFFYPFLLWN
jgi:hypothetical protein